MSRFYTCPICKQNLLPMNARNLTLCQVADTMVPQTQYEAIQQELNNSNAAQQALQQELDNTRAAHEATQAELAKSRRAEKKTAEHLTHCQELLRVSRESVSQLASQPVAEKRSRKATSHFGDVMTGERALKAMVKRGRGQQLPNWAASNKARDDERV